jgi:hypothetical protein
VQQETDRVKFAGPQFKNIILEAELQTISRELLDNIQTRNKWPPTAKRRSQRGTAGLGTERALFEYLQALADSDSQDLKLDSYFVRRTSIVSMCLHRSACKIRKTTL